MSNKDKIISLLDIIPDNKIGYVLAYIQGITADIAEPDEVDPDEWDIQMIAEAEKINDGATVSFDELLAKDGITYADLQD